MQKQLHFKTLILSIVLSFFFQLSFGQIEGKAFTTCLPNPCGNGGVCLVVSDSYECGCTEYFLGSQCQFPSTMTLVAPNAPVVFKNDVNVALDNNISATGFSGGWYNLPSTGPSDMTITFIITGGTLTLGTTDVTFGGDGNGSSSFTATGQAEFVAFDSDSGYPPSIIQQIDGALNIALNEATFTPTPNLFGVNAASITFTAVYGPLSSDSPATVTFDIQDSTLSVEDQLFEKNIKIYPIPVKDIINISNNSNNIISKIEIMDMLGNIVSTTNFSVFNSNLKIEVSNYNSGIYIMRISKDGYTLKRKIVLY